MRNVRKERAEVLHALCAKNEKMQTQQATLRLLDLCNRIFRHTLVFLTSDFSCLLRCYSFEFFIAADKITTVCITDLP